MSRSDTLIFALTRKWIVFLFIYFGTYILVGGVISIKGLCTLECDTEKSTLLRQAFMLSFSTSGMLCAVQYIRRLYKACISARIDTTADKIQVLGTIAYFIFRPVFTWCFVIILITGVLSGMYVVTGSLDYVLNEKFIYICMITSSYIGYSIGKTIDKFEKVSNKQVEELRV